MDMLLVEALNLFFKVRKLLRTDVNDVSVGISSVVPNFSESWII
jgi:hypothetical protein